MYFSKNLAFSACKFLHQPFNIFQNDSVILIFLISPENFNLEQLTIQFYVGNPVQNMSVMFIIYAIHLSAFFLKIFDKIHTDFDKIHTNFANAYRF